MLWLVAYDICDPKRLRQVATLCEDYGRRLQYSVFLCACSFQAIDRLQGQARSVMDLSCDRLVTLPICKGCLDQVRQHGPSMALPGTTDTLIV
ncbi:CRISPR-associated endonuclease Cas2 [Salisaeta longa]|uniref:CRISPR-associated endonuclease Cas2 n=1 Tax=Salisaeta longa TaxID=503170 RepID=UPI0003B4535B|nr:CRISPR-associated endonuclease Cas2 [Salisaeta longa]